MCEYNLLRNLRDNEIIVEYPDLYLKLKTHKMLISHKRWLLDNPCFWSQRWPLFGMCLHQYFHYKIYKSQPFTIWVVHSTLKEKYCFGNIIKQFFDNKHLHKVSILQFCSIYIMLIYILFMIFLFLSFFKFSWT